jgi:large subunit ribosomal protein L29
MKTSELRDLSQDELATRESELRRKHFDLKVRHSTAVVDSTAELRSLKRDIARVKTLIKENEAKASKGSES